jgi:hypothetical protein
MMQELRELRKENDALRRQVELFRGLQQHQPYATGPLVLSTPRPNVPRSSLSACGPPPPGC